MNTDNMSISGETIDYGPCAFMDAYDPATVFSSIDEIGRYAYGNQPRIALWNLTRFAECLLPLFSDDQEEAMAEAQSALGNFAANFDAAYLAGLRRKLGLFTARDDDPELAHDLLKAMAEKQADFTLTFRRLSDAALGPTGDAEVRNLFADPAAFDAWAVRWRQRIADEPQDAGRAAGRDAGRQPRLHSAQSPGGGDHRGRGEPQRFRAVRGASDGAVEALRGPAGIRRYAEPPKPDERVLQTFCGT